MSTAKLDDLPKDAREIYDEAQRKALGNNMSEDLAKSVGWAAVDNAGYSQVDGKFVKTNVKKLTTLVKVAKVEKEEGRVFGWAYVSQNGTGVEVVDHSGQSAEIEEVEKAFYEFNKQARRSSGEMHIIEDGEMIECMVFTKEKWEALGVDPEGRPLGAWVGFEFDLESEIWKGVKDGRYTMFSIEGTAIEEFISDAA